MPKKKMCIANFNTVFETSNKELPMLDYFDTIIIPALTCGYIKKSNDAKFFFDEIKVIEDKDGEYVLTGILIKDTLLEVRHNYDFQEGRLLDKNGKYQSSPYSLFIIYLKNHRMILVRDQKGSPSLSNFRTTIKSAIDVYVRKTNRLLEQENKELLPIPLVNVVGISTGNDINNVLNNVDRVSKLMLRFYPLNGDGDVKMAEVFEGILKTRRDIKCSTGSISYNSPQRTDKVGDLINNVDGTMEPIVWVRYPGSSVDSKITMDSIIENTEISVAHDDTKMSISQIMAEGKKNKKISDTSEENSVIYRRNKEKIIPFLKQ